MHGCVLHPQAFFAFAFIVSHRHQNAEWLHTFFPFHPIFFRKQNLCAQKRQMLSMEKNVGGHKPTAKYGQIIGARVWVCVRRANTLNRETNLRNIQCKKIEYFIAQVSFTLPFDVCASAVRCPSKRRQIPSTSTTNSLHSARYIANFKIDNCRSIGLTMTHTYFESIKCCAHDVFLVHSLPFSLSPFLSLSITLSFQ